MRPNSKSTVSYTPGDPPNDPAELGRFLARQFAEISAAVGMLAAGHSDPQSAPPAKPRDGDERYADGTNWNPGSGRGKYLYKINTWVFLG